jgi:hypothetical protein
MTTFIVSLGGAYSTWYRLAKYSRYTPHFDLLDICRKIDISPLTLEVNKYCYCSRYSSFATFPLTKDHFFQSKILLNLQGMCIKVKLKSTVVIFIYNKNNEDIHT